MKPLVEFGDFLYWRLPIPDITDNGNNLEMETDALWVGRLKETISARKFGLLLSQVGKTFQKMWKDPLPDDWKTKLPDEITIKDDGHHPATIVLAQLDQDLVRPEPVESRAETATAVILCQAAVRGFLVRQEVRRQTRAVTTIQSWWRSILVMREEKKRVKPVCVTSRPKIIIDKRKKVKPVCVTSRPKIIIDKRKRQNISNLV